MGKSFQNDLHGFGNAENYRNKRFSQPNGAAIYNISKHNNSKPKMAETLAAKILNLLGLTVYIIGVGANLFSTASGAISLLLGISGAIWMFFRALKMREDWIITKIEKKKMQDNVKRYNKKHPL